MIFENLRQTLDPPEDIVRVLEQLPPPSVVTEQAICQRCSARFERVMRPGVPFPVRCGECGPS